MSSERRDGPVHASAATQASPTQDPRLADTMASGDASVEVFDRGATIGRYVLLECIGSGGMGVVYAAYDPELDRKVAVKLLKASEGDATGRARLLREAQALARLAHPNVVAVHDVGTFAGEVFVAMEFIHGTTLRRWLAERSRGWREVVAVFTAVGRGLMAAHAAGLVHRDLKPDNVMIGADERVRVMDFGLARAAAAEESTRTPSGAALTLELTRQGAWLGTPAYMAPEQWELAATDARTDQFAFCVSLWEALYGERPFRGATLPSLMAAVTGGEMVASGDRGVPGWLRRVLERGLATTPAKRWPTMAALVAELERGRARGRVKIAVLGVAAVVMIVGGIVGWQRLEVARRTEVCAAAGREIAETWGEETREGLRAAFAASGASYAATTVEKVLPWLDRQAAAWQAARTDACMRMEVDAVWDAELFGRAVWCLDERRMELAATVAEFMRADVATVQAAVPTVAGLGAIGSCVDEGYLRGQSVSSAEDRAAVEEIRGELSRARALARAGKSADGLALTKEAYARAVSLGWRPLVIRAGIQEGGQLRDTGAYAQAEAALRGAYFEAVQLGLWDPAVDAATGLIALTGDDLARAEDGRTWYAHAEATAAHASDPEGLRAANRRNSLAVVLATVGEYAEAQSMYEQVLVAREQALGAEHPTVGYTINNLAIVRASVGEVAEARALFARALAIKERALGPDNPEVGEGLGNLAMVTEDAGEAAEAEVLYRRAIAVLSAAVGPGHPSVTNAQLGLAEFLRKRGEYAEALALSRDAVASFERALGAEHPDVASALVNLANLYLRVGAHEEARALLVRAIGIYEPRLGEDHPELAVALSNLAMIDLETGRPAAALPRAERAVAILEAHPGEQTGEPEAHFCLAQALVLTNGERSRARAEVARAREGYTAIGAARAVELAELEAWAAEQL